MQSSIVIPHYKTPDHLEWCLRCLAHFTDEPHEVVVVDNGSGEAMVAPLRERKDIVLVEREQGPDLDQVAHMEALDAGIARARGRHIVGLHTDTFVFRRGWLRFLRERLEAQQYLAYGPSHHRLYPPTLAERLREWWRPEPDDRRWIRPVFTIYRREIFEERKFADYGDVGELTASYVDAGRAGFLPRREAAEWAFHVGGTTKLKLLQHRKRARKRKDRHWQRFLARDEVRALLTESPSLGA